MTHIVALTGYAGVGKDTFAKHLVDNHDYVRLAFADKLKDLLYEVNPNVIPEYGPDTGSLREQLEEWGSWDEVKRAVPEIRRLLQGTGMAARQVLGEYVWIKPVIREAKRHSHVVITDLRMDNEMQMLRGSLFESVIVLRLTRAGIGPANDHISETPLPHDIEVVLDSVGVEDMAQAVSATVGVIELHRAGIYGHRRSSDGISRRTTTPTLLNDAFFQAFDEARS